MNRHGDRETGGGSEREGSKEMESSSFTKEMERGNKKKVIWKQQRESCDNHEN